MDTELGRSEIDRILKDSYGFTAEAVRPLTGGRVNQTFLVESSEAGLLVLQKLNSFFEQSPALGDNWQLIWQALADKGGPLIPQLLVTRQGKYLALDDKAEAWRLSRYLPLRPLIEKNAKTAFGAARILSQAHYNLNYPKPLTLQALPPGEFTNHHLCKNYEFDDIFNFYRGHPHLDEVRPLIEAAAGEASLLPQRPSFVSIFTTAPLIVHGDPKSDNFMLNDDGEVCALLDWDTAQFAHPLLDLGEMGRSFAVIKLPDGRAGFSAEILAALIAGYQAGGFELSCHELEILPAVIRALALNLARRYLIDSLAELYFKWDTASYPSLYQQNKERGQTMLSLVSELLDRDFELSQLCRSLAF